ncbi:MAG TPA: hypothetical protein VGI19_07250 [Candidatus Cybelea sp.]|jgi:hypothetical protein
MALWAYNMFLVHTSATGTSVFPTRDGRGTIAVRPDSGAALAGLHTGDVVDLRAATPTQRWEYCCIEPAGSHVTYFVVRNGRDIPVDVVVPAHARLLPEEWFIDFSIPWMLLFAAIIFSSANNRRAQILGVLLLTWAWSNQLSHGSLWTPWVKLSFAADLVNYALNSLQIVLLVAYAATFGTLGTLKRTVSAVLLGSAVLQFVLFLADDVTIASGMPWFTVPAGLAELIFSANLVGCALLLLCTIPSAGRERSVLIWTAVPIAIVCFTLAFIVTLRVVMPGAPPALWRAALIAVDVGFFIMPAGLTYAILARRVLSADFVLNRAAVFSGVSLVIVGAFMLVEWALGDWLQGESHATGLAVNGAVAIALGMSIRFVHGRVDHVLDTVFFRKRHEDEHALRAFAHEASFFTDAKVLKQRTVGVLEKHADASFVHFVEDKGDDPAMVTLRATHKPVDLTAVDSTSIEGDWAYPLVARGHMQGALVLGPKRSSESYAPDESEAITQLAHGVAGALEMDKAQSDGALERMRELLEKLPDRLAERLRPN